MATKQNLWIDTDGASVEAGAKAIAGALGGLEKNLKRTAAALTAVFAADYLTDAAKNTQSLQKEFLVLRLALGKLKSAVGEALTPIGQLLLPVLQDVVYAATRGVKFIGGILAGLLGTSSAMDDLAQSTRQAGKAAKSLAGFDQITRLAKNDSPEEALERTGENLTLLQRSIISRIQDLFAPLKEIDLSKAVEAFKGLQTAIEPITRHLFAGLEWAWYNLLVPLAGWTVGEALPAFLNLVSAALGLLDKVIQALQPYAQWLWEECLQPLARWTGEAVIRALGFLTEKLNALSLWMSENQETVRKMTDIVAAFLAVWAVGKIGAWLTEAGGIEVFFTRLAGLVAGAVAAFQMLSDAASAVWEGVEKAFFLGTEVLRERANKIIHIVNGLVKLVIDLINGVIGDLNNLQFTVPSWLPGGGTTVGFSIPTIPIPQIPHLAQGAVLPANKPFLAMVGDQRHGTNVEAPLATIQEAVALVMEDQTAAMMAGFEASVGVQQEILQAVLGISIGDEMIARAAERYQRKMAVVRGGRL